VIVLLCRSVCLQGAAVIATFTPNGSATLPFVIPIEPGTFRIVVIARRVASVSSAPVEENSRAFVDSKKKRVLPVCLYFQCLNFGAHSILSPKA
jgi:hypothetical protein